MRPYLRAANVGWRGLTFDDVKEMAFTERESETYELRRGDLLLAEASGSPGEVGKPGMYNGQVEGCCFQNTLMRVRLGDGFSPAFFELYFREQALNGRFAAGSRGVGIHHLGAATLSAWPVPVLSMNEQERIVAVLDEAFSKLDAGEAALRTVRQKLKRMRESVLAAAVTGQLVPQDPTDTPASKLLSDIGASSIEGCNAVPKNWSWALLGQLLREPLRNGVSAVKAESSIGLPTFSITAVTTGDFSSKNIKFTVADWAKATDLWAEADDIFVQRSNTPELVGTARLYRGAHRAAVFPDLLIRVRTIDTVLPRWVEVAMSSPVCRRFVRSQAKGLAGSMPKISQPTLERLPIPLPPTGEQDRIVAEVERQFSVLDACERAVDAGLARSAALRRSVLKAAVEGRLVPQDPSDEPASVLLERIRAERAASGPVKSGRGRKKMETS